MSTGPGVGVGRGCTLAPAARCVHVSHTDASKAGLDVYYIHKFSANGVYLGDRVAFVQETAALRKVEGGIDEPALVS